MSVGNKYNNDYMESTFKETKSYGMKLVHLDLWEPEPNDFKKFKTQAKDAFNSSFEKAIIYLIKEKMLTPIEAVVEVNHLTSAEAYCLDTFYDLGINGQFIRDHRHEYELVNSANTLWYLVKDMKLSRDEALREIKGLDAPEKLILRLFYAKGMRADLLRALRVGDDGKEIADLFKTMASYDISREKLNYLVSVIKADIAKGITWKGSFEDAAYEARLLSTQNDKDRMKFLMSHVKDGVRANDVPAIFNKEKQKAYRVLRWVHRLSVINALAQMKDLDNEQILLLRKHFKAGINHEVIVNYPHSFAVTEGLMKHCHWKPVDAIKNLSTLTVTQARYLHDFAGHGLTLAQAHALKCDDYSVTKKDVVLSMVEWGSNLHEALEKVMTMSDVQAQEMLSHTVSFPRVVSIKL